MMDNLKEVKKLGQGAYGTVYLVENETGKRYVLKEIELDSNDEQARYRALAEIHFMHKLKHPNIVNILEHYDEKNAVYILMEYADGGDLEKFLKCRKREGGLLLTEDLVLDWFVQICLALKHCHDRKILHRDLKSPNIFLTKGADSAQVPQFIKIGDFGVAKGLSNTMSNAQTQIGTPYYLSPEICLDRPYNHKSDMWALGVVLYEMCTLHRPFQAKNMVSLIRKILEENPESIPSDTYSSELSKLVNALLSKQSQNRPSVNQVLKLPFLRQRIERFLSANEYLAEFSHTVLHGAKFAPSASMSARAKAQREGNSNGNDQGDNNCAVGASGGVGDDEERVDPFSVSVTSANGMTGDRFGEEEGEEEEEEEDDEYEYDDDFEEFDEDEDEDASECDDRQDMDDITVDVNDPNQITASSIHSFHSSGSINIGITSGSSSKNDTGPIDDAMVKTYEFDHRESEEDGQGDVDAQHQLHGSSREEKGERKLMQLNSNSHRDDHSNTSSSSSGNTNSSAVTDSFNNQNGGGNGGKVNNDNDNTYRHDDVSDSDRKDDVALAPQRDGNTVDKGEHGAKKTRQIHSYNTDTDVHTNVDVTVGANERMHAVQCVKCHQIVDMEDMLMEEGTAHCYHRQCFTCSVCSASLLHTGFVQSQGQMICYKCDDAEMSEEWRCEGCYHRNPPFTLTCEGPSCRMERRWEGVGVIASADVDLDEGNADEEGIKRHGSGKGPQKAANASAPLSDSMVSGELTREASMDVNVSMGVLDRSMSNTTKLSRNLHNNNETDNDDRSSDSLPRTPTYEEQKIWTERMGGSPFQHELQHNKEYNNEYDTEYNNEYNDHPVHGYLKNARSDNDRGPQHLGDRTDDREHAQAHTITNESENENARLQLELDVRNVREEIAYMQHKQNSFPSKQHESEKQKQIRIEHELQLQLLKMRCMRLEEEADSKIDAEQCSQSTKEALAHRARERSDSLRKVEQRISARDPRTDIYSSNQRSSRNDDKDDIGGDHQYQDGLGDRHCLENSMYTQRGGRALPPLSPPPPPPPYTASAATARLSSSSSSSSPSYANYKQNSMNSSSRYRRNSLESAPAVPYHLDPITSPSRYAGGGGGGMHTHDAHNTHGSHEVHGNQYQRLHHQRQQQQQQQQQQHQQQQHQHQQHQHQQHQHQHQHQQHQQQQHQHQQHQPSPQSLMIPRPFTSQHLHQPYHRNQERLSSFHRTHTARSRSPRDERQAPLTKSDSRYPRIHTAAAATTSSDGHNPNSFHHHPHHDQNNGHDYNPFHNPHQAHSRDLQRSYTDNQHHYHIDGQYQKSFHRSHSHNSHLIASHLATPNPHHHGHRNFNQDLPADDVHLQSHLKPHSIHDYSYGQTPQHSLHRPYTGQPGGLTGKFSSADTAYRHTPTPAHAHAHAHTRSHSHSNLHSHLHPRVDDQPRTYLPPPSHSSAQLHPTPSALASTQDGNHTHPSSSLIAPSSTPSPSPSSSSSPSTAAATSAAHANKKVPDRPFANFTSLPSPTSPPSKQDRKAYVKMRKKQMREIQDRIRKDAQTQETTGTESKKEEETKKY